MKTAIGVLGKYKEVENTFSSLRTYSLGDVLLAMEEYASQFKQSVPITEEEIIEIIKSKSKGEKFGTIKGIEESAKEIKDRLQSDAVVFAEWLRINWFPLSSGEWIKMQTTENTSYPKVFKTNQELYNSQEFKDFKNNLKK